MITGAALSATGEEPPPELLLRQIARWWGNYPLPDAGGIRQQDLRLMMSISKCEWVIGAVHKFFDFRLSEMNQQDHNLIGELRAIGILDHIRKKINA